MMNRFFTLLLAASCLTAVGQGTFTQELPFNPDSNGDNLIGVQDLQSFLATYGQSYGLPPAPCTYDGTPMEEFVAAVWTEDVIIDSLYWEYELFDISEYYAPGCPDPIVDTLIFASSAMFGSPNWSTLNGLHLSFGGQNIRLYFNGEAGTYYWRFYDGQLSSLGFLTDGFFGDAYPHDWTEQYQLPFPDGWFFDEDGLHVDDGWGVDDWPFYATRFILIPYWHYAE